MLHIIKVGNELQQIHYEIEELHPSECSAQVGQ